MELLERFVAEWRPDLFPHIEGAKWVHREEYEVPAVTQLKQEVHEVQVQATRTIDQLQRQITELRGENTDRYTLLRGTGDELASAVIRSLRTVGFNNVIDVDEEERGNGNQNLREDIRVDDRSPILVIDVKGIGGCPEDAAATQSEKHATMRMREWDRTDVKPLTIVNHQRHLPPLERTGVVYREEIVGNAEQRELGLMTTWDLFRILRNQEHLGWDSQVITPIFYRNGVIRPVPEHYQHIGTVAQVWSEAFGVQIAEHELKVGDRIAVEFPILFEEMEIGSLQINGKPVQQASVGDPAGILWDESKPKVREKMNVYRILRN